MSLTYPGALLLPCTVLECATLGQARTLHPVADYLRTWRCSPREGCHRGGRWNASLCPGSGNTHLDPASGSSGVTLQMFQKPRRSFSPWALEVQFHPPGMLLPWLSPSWASPGSSESLPKSSHISSSPGLSYIASYFFPSWLLYGPTTVLSMYSLCVHLTKYIVVVSNYVLNSLTAFPS